MLIGGDVQVKDIILTKRIYFEKIVFAKYKKNSNTSSCILNIVYFFTHNNF